MMVPMTPGRSHALKINCHDPRGHQAFLQLSKDMHSWQAYAGDDHWWLEREKQCLELFQQYGYDLQSGVWYCLITCQRSGWRGIASSSLLLANGFTKQQSPCWPPLGAYDLRRQVLDWYCTQVLPQLYELPVTGAGIQVQQHMLTAVELLQQCAVTLQSSHNATLLQLSVWLVTNIKYFEQPLHAPVGLPSQNAFLKFDPVITPPATRSAWIMRGVYGGIGVIAGITGMIIALGLRSPDVIIASNKIWPENILFTTLQKRLEQESSVLPAHRTDENLSHQLKILEQRLLDAEQKRKPYMTISELKTAIYQMKDMLAQQNMLIESKLNQVQNKITENQAVPEFELQSLASQIQALESRYLLLKFRADIVVQK